MKIIVIYHSPSDAEVTEIPDGDAPISICLEAETLHVSRPGKPGLVLELENAEHIYINPYPGQMSPTHAALVKPRES